MKNYFQNIHYNKITPNPILYWVLGICEFFYCSIIKLKNLLYKKNILKEKTVDIEVICVGNLTTGGVGKTPVVEFLANEISKTKKTAILSRGYGAKLQNKTPNIIKNKKIFYKDASLCGDEIFQLAQKTKEDVIIITCKNRYLGAKCAKELGAEVVILDDGFSNRTLKKDKTYVLIDSKMKFGNNHLLPKGPLREPTDEIKRADEIILVDKGDKDLKKAIMWLEENFKLPYKIAQMKPYQIYNIKTLEKITPENKSAIAFCAIGQAEQFFDFAGKYFEIKDKISFPDHHKYAKNDIENLIQKAKENNLNTFITTQKDEGKIRPYLNQEDGFEFLVLELKTQLDISCI